MTDSSFYYLHSEYFPSPIGYTTQQSNMIDDLVDGEEDVLSSIAPPPTYSSMLYEQNGFNVGDILAQSSDANAAPWDPHAVIEDNATVMSYSTLRPEMPQSYTMSEGQSFEEQSAKDSGYGSIRLELGCCLICLEEKKSLKYFKNNADKKKHELTHTRPFKCGERNCQNVKGFPTKNDLERHAKDKHGKQPARGPNLYYRCAHQNCSRKKKLWTRKDNFKAHIERTHKDVDGDHIDMMVKASECKPLPAELEALARKKNEPKPNKIYRPKKPKAANGKATLVNELPGPVVNIQFVESNSSETSTEIRHDFGPWYGDQSTQSWGVSEDNVLDRSDDESQGVGTSWLWNPNEFASEMNSGQGSFAGAWSPGMFEMNFGHYPQS